jgi:hypothetical protein
MSKRDEFYLTDRERRQLNHTQPWWRKPLAILGAIVFWVLLIDGIFYMVTDNDSDTPACEATGYQQPCYDIGQTDR